MLNGRVRSAVFSLSSNKPPSPTPILDSVQALLSISVYCLHVRPWLVTTAVVRWKSRNNLVAISQPLVSKYKNVISASDLFHCLC